MQGALSVLDVELAALTEVLTPGRRGPRPQMPALLPHIQENQWPSAARVAELVEGACGLRNVVVRQSRMASPGAAALALVDGYTAGPADAFIDIPEFCHLLAAPEGGIHLTLPQFARNAAIEMGWGEPHPAALLGAVSPCLISVYAPRDSRELEAALALVETSWRFARGELGER